MTTFISAIFGMCIGSIIYTFIENKDVIHAVVTVIAWCMYIVNLVN